MRAIILTISMLGLCGVVGAWGGVESDGKSTQTFITKTVYDLAADTIIAETTFFYENYLPCTVFVVDTVWLPPDSLFKKKWDAFDAYIDSVLKEIK